MLSRIIDHSSSWPSSWVLFFRKIYSNTGKKSRVFKVFELPGTKCITTVSKENFKKKSDDDDGGFQQQSPQRLDIENEHMDSRNDH